MSDTLIIQIAEGHYFKKVQALYASYLAEYCEQWDVDYWLHGGPIWPWSHNSLVPNLAPWGKYELIAAAFRQGYKKVAYMDVDSFICDPNTDIRWAFVKSVNAVRWWPNQATTHLQGGDMYFWHDPQNYAEAKALGVIQYLMREAKYYLQRFPDLRGWFDQGQLNEFQLSDDGAPLFHELDVRWNWCPDYCGECHKPVVRSFHSYVSLGKDLYAEMQKVVKEYYGTNNQS